MLLWGKKFIVDSIKKETSLNIKVDPSKTYHLVAFSRWFNVSNTIMQVVIKLANKAPPDSEIIVSEEGSVRSKLYDEIHTTIVSHNCIEATNPVANKISLPLNANFSLVLVLRWKIK